jgi:hypothetical protein
MVTLIAGDQTIHWTADAVLLLRGLCSSTHFNPPSVLQWLPASNPNEEDHLDVLYQSQNC